MNKNIVITLLSLLTLVFGITTLVNRTEADKLHEIAEVHILEAEEQREIALMYADSMAVARERAIMSK